MSGFKLSVSRKALADALTIVAPAIPLRPQLPILAAVELRVVDGSLSIRATDHYLTIWQTIDAEVQSDGIALVSGHRLRSVVSAFTSPRVELVADGDAMVATSGRSTFDIQTMNPVDFPEPLPLGPITGTTTADVLADALKRIQHASGGDEIDSVRGIEISSDGSALTISATDRFAMAIIDIAYSGAPFTARLLFTEASAAVKGVSGALTLHASDSRLAFAGESGGMSAPLIDTPYPQIASIVDKAGKGESFIVEREALAESLGRAGLSLVKDGTVVTTVSGNELTINARDESSAITEVVELIDATGDEQFGVNPTYLANLLNCMTEPLIEIALPVGGNGAVRITGIDSNERSADRRVLMTKRINY